MNTGQLLACIFLNAYRHIVAERLLFHVVTMNSISPGPAPTTDIYILALAALSFIGLEVPQVLKNFGILPDFTEWSLLYISGGPVEVRAGLDVTETVDQTDRLGGNASLTASSGERQRTALKIDP